MKEYSTKDIRNVVLLGATKSGKTSLSEAILFEGKVIDRRGTVEDKNTVSDYTEIEKLNQRSIYGAPLYAEFEGKKINVIDAPGADDFCGGAFAAFKVCENGILLVNAQQGVEVGTEIFARHAGNAKLPLVLAINQLDSEKADWDNLQNSLKEAFGGKPVYVQFPVNPGTAFDAFVDVLTMKYYKFTDQNGKCTVSDIPAEFADQAETMHAELVEKAAEYDEELMMKFFDEGDLSEEEIIKGLSTGYANGDAYPVFCLSAKKDVGVRRLLEFITHLGIVPAGDESAPASLYIYKTDVEQHLGEVSFFKVMSGIVTTGVDFEEPNSGSKERFSALYAVAGLKKESVTSLHAGDFGCVVKLKNGKAGTTLCAIGAGLDYGKIAYPAPKYRCAIKAKVQQDEQKLGDALKKIASQDPTVIVEYSKELRQTILSGNGEQHINVVKWRLNNEFGLDVELFAPKVPYRETITKVACAQYRHKKQSGGAGQFGEVHLLVCPAEGEKERMVEGPLTGSYARDIRVFVYDGKMHPVDSKEIAFIIAGRNAFREAFRNAGPKILEPIYNVEVMTPAEYQGACMSDLQNRRGILGDMGSDKGFAILKARVPLAELYRYSTTLSSITSGSATFTMEFADYQPVPGDVQTKLLADYAAQEEED